MGELTLPRLRALQKAWKSVPPLPAMVAAWLGIKPEAEDEKPHPIDQEIQAEYDRWLEDHLNKVQASGGMVSNMVVQAQEGSR